VDFGIARDLDQLDGPLAPFAHGLDPQARPPFEALVVVLEGAIVALALQKAEAARVVVHESRNLQRLGIVYGAPQPLAVAV
jgi:hypothetical protein